MSGFHFDRTPTNSTDVGLSVICINLNHVDYLEDCIHSVLSQKFDDFEFIIADGGSTDGSLDIIRQYRFIKLIEGPDSGTKDGFTKAMAAARGRNIMLTTSTDGYVSRDWFRTACQYLDRNDEVSMAWGSWTQMAKDGPLSARTGPQEGNKTANRDEWFQRWITSRKLSGAYLPELNYCMRSNVFRSCWADSVDFSPANTISDSVLKVHFEFNRRGFLHQYLPVLANFGREHNTAERPQLQFTEWVNSSVDAYDDALAIYRKSLEAGERIHVFRDGKGNVIS